MADRSPYPPAPQTQPSVDDYDPKAGILYLSWTTSAACPTPNDTPPPNQDEGNNKDDDPPEDDDGESGRDPVGNSKGLGFFGWFITLLFLGFAGYLILGAYHNRTTYGATGWDMVPHRDVWRDLPYVVSDLFKGSLLFLLFPPKCFFLADTLMTPHRSRSEQEWLFSARVESLS